MNHALREWSGLPWHPPFPSLASRAWKSELLAVDRR